MELTVKMELDRSDMMQAVAEWAATRIPAVPGYHVEVELAYGYSGGTARLVKDAEVPPLQEGGE